MTKENNCLKPPRLVDRLVNTCSHDKFPTHNTLKLYIFPPKSKGKTWLSLPLTLFVKNVYFPLRLVGNFSNENKCDWKKVTEKENKERQKNTEKFNLPFLSLVPKEILLCKKKKKQQQLRSTHIMVFLLSSAAKLWQRYLLSYPLDQNTDYNLWASSVQRCLWGNPQQCYPRYLVPW